MKTEPIVDVRPRSQCVDDAVQAAIAGNWAEAVQANRLIIDRFGPDEESYNRLGKSLIEIADYKEARKAYQKSLELNPLNQIAQKNLAKLEVLESSKGQFKLGPTKVDPNLFVEEMGKTITTTLEDVSDKDVHNKAGAGDIAELTVTSDGIAAETVRGVRLGLLEPRLSRRLTKLINGGNRYIAAVMVCEPGMVKIMIRETYQDPAMIGKPSFPVRRKRETEFRPYTKESLIERDAPVSYTDDDDAPEEVEDEPDLVANFEDDDADGLGVEEEEVPLEFADDSADDEDEEE